MLHIFSSSFDLSTSAPAELADLVWAFARLGVKLPPAFASSSQRRLQMSMGQLPAAQLVRMLWSLSYAGFHPTEPQLKAYAQKVMRSL